MFGYLFAYFLRSVFLCSRRIDIATLETPSLHLWKQFGHVEVYFSPSIHRDLRHQRACHHEKCRQPARFTETYSDVYRQPLALQRWFLQIFIWRVYSSSRTSTGIDDNGE
ncbi:hypothetical protein L3Y34_012838 [Caenorhabditis briggsae]|uniref:Uncharacterized protein n=1 Tax=Caenorhabditis briggsae TaxID=6238 RepID=A0AAE8ZTN4_CAEBR|nr:hypothetical protein L3Y34_012838 [Caenorhabditis briggsae]